MDWYQFVGLALLIGVYIFTAGKHSGEVVAELKGIHDSLDKVVDKVDNHESRISQLEGRK